MVLNSQKVTTASMGNGQRCWLSFPGSESMACNESNGVNVGEPASSLKDESIGLRAEAKEAKKICR